MNSFILRSKPNTIVDLVIEQCLANPYAVAVEYRNEVITYLELHRRSNQLANYLLDRGIAKEMIVPVFLDHSVNVVIAIVGVLKAGAAYLPIDPEFPQGRIAYMLEDADPPLIITNSSCAGKLADCTSFSTLALDLDWSLIQSYSAELPDHLPGKLNLAYVMYTSGSTGRPKGVMVEHSQIFSYTVSACEKLGLIKCERIGLLGTFSSDACLLALFGSLRCGKRLYVIDIKKMPGFRELVAYFETRALDCYKTTPSLMASFLQIKDVKRMLPSGRLLLGGEECAPGLITELNRLLEPSCALINHYGPTETTVAVLTYQFPREEWSGDVLLGQPLADTGVHILGDNIMPVPAGTIGELHISGSFVSRGYLNNPVMTAEKFIYKNIAGEEKRLYNTGDQVMMVPNGNIRNFGRADDQVKINGHRIELKEIEHQIMQSGAVLQCLAIAKDTRTGEKRLTAYIQPAENFNQSRLSAHLQAVLPLYMMPKKFVVMQDWPRTINNKVDRKLLSDLDSEDSLPVEPADKLANDVMGKLRGIWSKELGIMRIDENADFFELGGDSLQLIKLSFAIEDQVGVAIAPYELFDCLTLKKQENLVSSKLKAPVEVVSIDVSENTEASKVQMNLFIQHKFNPGESFPNVSAALEIKGEIDVDRLNDCFTRVIKYNESLRTAFILKKGVLQQHINHQFEFNLITHTATTNDVDHEIQALTSPFHFEIAPLIRAFVISFPDTRRFLYIDMPHIISDGESIKVILDELEALYNDNLDQSNKNQFRHYQKAASLYLESDSLKEDEQYWQGQFADEFRPVNFPARNPTTNNSRYAGVQVVTAFPSRLLSRIKEVVKVHRLTRFQLLYAAYLLLIHKVFDKQEFLVMVPVHNRQARAFQKVVGLLTNVILQKAQIDRSIPFLQFVKMQRKHMLEALKHQRYPVESLIGIWKKKGYDFKNSLKFFFGYHFHRDQYTFGNARLSLHIPCGNRENLPLSVAVFETEARMFIKLSSVDNVYSESVLVEIIQSFFDLLDRLSNDFADETLESILNTSPQQFI